MFITTSNEYLSNNRILFFLRHIVAIIIPIVLMWTLYHSVLQDTWWLADDPALLKNIVEHGIFSHFYQSEVWRNLSSSSITPWIILSLGIDWHLFGLEPLGYYWHNLLSFTLVIIIAYIVLNLFFSSLVCSLTLSFFVVSVPSIDIVQFLMARHYLEGLGLSLLAILGYVKAVKTQRLTWAYLGSAFYLLATTAKEIYVPLIVILPCLPVGSWAQRWRMLIPFLVMVGSYILWRAYMLNPSNLLTGYGDVRPTVNWDNLYTLPNRVADVLGWSQTWQLFIILFTALICLGIIINKLPYWQIGCLLLWLMATILPIIPVLVGLVSRYLFLPYFMFCLALAFGLQSLINKRWYYVGLGLVMSLLVVGVKSIESGAMFIRQAEQLKQTRIEGEFILMANSEDALLLNPKGPHWYYQSLRWFRENVLKLPKGARICYDLCVCQQSTDKVYHYVQGHIKSSNLSKSEQNCGTRDVALSVKLQLANGILHWQLGSYQQGQYYATISTQKDMISGEWIPLPAQGGFPYGLSEILYLVIKYTSPEGWHTYSPILTLDPAKKDAQGNVELIWKR